MKRFLSMILVLVCLFAMVGCDTDPTSNPDSSGPDSNTNQSQGGITPDGDNILNEDGTLNIPSLDDNAFDTVDDSTWQALLSEDSIRASMKENSLTMLTDDSDKDAYQMFYCAGGRYGSIQKGNYYSETICTVEDEKVYIYKRDSADASWTRTVATESYDEYVANHYTSNAMVFLSGIASVYKNAQYVEAENAYVISNHVIAHPTGEDLPCKLQVQFANGKLYSISLLLEMDGQTGSLTTVFGTVSTPEIPTDFQEGSNTSSGSSTEDKNDHHEPAASVCSEKEWQRIFGQDRLLKGLMEFHSTVKIDNSRNEYLYQMDMDYSRIVISTEDRYQELLINEAERFQRDSKDGQWTRYAGRNHHKEYDTILNDSTKVLRQILTPLANLYGQASFDAPNRTFLLENVAIEHETFGSVKVDYIIVISGSRIIEKLEANIRSANDSWTLTLKEDKGAEITLPTDYIDMSEKK